MGAGNGSGPKGDEGEAKEGLSWPGKDGLQAGVDGAAQKDRDGVTARERTGKGRWAGRDWGILLTLIVLLEGSVGGMTMK